MSDRMARMARMARITRIVLYPIKSLDGISVGEARVSAQGALEHDRRYAIVDAEGRFVNGKRLADVHRLRARYDGSGSRVTLHAGGEERTFRLDAEREALAAWLGAFFGFPVYVRDDPESGFPDDQEAFGPTIISTATLALVAGWFPAKSEAQMRMRFRTNLEIGEVPAFWEDRLYGEPGTTVPFTVGAVCFEGTNPCQRCVVPARDPLTGTEDSGFQKTLATRRRETLPAWAPRSRFNHFYRLAVNTRIPPSEAGKAIRVGDPVDITGPCDAR